MFFGPWFQGNHTQSFPRLGSDLPTHSSSGPPGPRASSDRSDKNTANHFVVELSGVRFTPGCDIQYMAMHDTFGLK